MLAVASRERRALISCDRGFANVIQHPPDGTAGIVVIRLRNRGCGACVRSPSRSESCFSPNASAAVCGCSMSQGFVSGREALANQRRCASEIVFAVAASDRMALNGTA